MISSTWLMSCEGIAWEHVDARRMKLIMLSHTMIAT